jgi:hypothetical protein
VYFLAVLSTPLSGRVPYATQEANGNDAKLFQQYPTFNQVGFAAKRGICSRGVVSGDRRIIRFVARRASTEAGDERFTLVCFERGAPARGTGCAERRVSQLSIESPRPSPSEHSRFAGASAIQVGSGLIRIFVIGEAYPVFRNAQ